MAKTTQLELRLGMDFDYEVTIKNEDESACLDVSAWALSWMVKYDQGDADALAQLVKTTALGGIVVSGVFNTDPTLNTQLVTISIADTDTDALLPGCFVYELKRTDAGFETPLAEGIIDFVGSVHKT